MLNIRTQIRTDLNLSKRIRSRIRSKNIRTVFISTCAPSRLLVTMEGDPRVAAPTQAGWVCRPGQPAPNVAVTAAEGSSRAPLLLLLVALPLPCHRYRGTATPRHALLSHFSLSTAVGSGCRLGYVRSLDLVLVRPGSFDAQARHTLPVCLWRSTHGSTRGAR